ncbi:unnamed protein product [Gongylonema pulchrum]|uniref:BSD domain-containing protein n=1 Tax=Gongylonema pulchrum TaxID=637853 RepID=A0A183E839_9BILA|nr:unnamed protein product [Gongylonema pulchrum]
MSDGIAVSSEQVAKTLEQSAVTADQDKVALLSEFKTAFVEAGEANGQQIAAPEKPLAPPYFDDLTKNAALQSFENMELPLRATFLDNPYAYFWKTKIKELLGRLALLDVKGYTF